MNRCICIGELLLAIYHKQLSEVNPDNNESKFTIICCGEIEFRFTPGWVSCTSHDIWSDAY